MARPSTRAARLAIGGGGYERYFNRTGSIIVLLTTMALAVIVSTHFSFGRLFEAASQESRDLSARGVGWLRRWSEERRKDRERRDVIAKHTKKAGAAVPASHQPPRAELPASGSAAPVVARKQMTVAPPLPLPEPVAPTSSAPRRSGAYTLPPASLLDAAKAEQKIDERELRASARQLEEKCREFAVEGQVAQIHPGPVVTTFEFKPEAGVRYSKITGLQDDLCLAMQAESVLIDRIPGKSTVGIQIPNPNREAISLRDSWSPTATSARPRSSRSGPARRSMASRISPISPRCLIC